MKKNFMIVCLLIGSFFSFFGRCYAANEIANVKNGGRTGILRINAKDTREAFDKMVPKVRSWQMPSSNN